jgi:hypothetical protein
MQPQPPDYSDSIQIRRQIHELIQKQNELQPAYSKAKVYLAVVKDLKKRLLAKWVYAAPNVSQMLPGQAFNRVMSEASKENWALAQKGYLEEVGAIEVHASEAQQVKDEYEKIQPQLDMLRSELSYIGRVETIR